MKCWQGRWIMGYYYGYYFRLQGCCSLTCSPLIHPLHKKGKAAARPFTMRLLEVHHKICPGGFGALLVLCTSQKSREPLIIPHIPISSCSALFSLLWLWSGWIKLLLNTSQIKLLWHEPEWANASTEFWRSCLSSLILSQLVMSSKLINNQVLGGVSG